MGLFANLEFHRTGVGLLSDPHEQDSGSAVRLSGVAGTQRPLMFCSCAAGRRKTCHHLEELERQLDQYHQVAGQSWQEDFGSSLWYRVAQILFEGERQSVDEALIARAADGSFAVLSPNGQDLIRYVDESPATFRFLERLGKLQKSGKFSDRSGLLDRLAMFLRTPEEQHLNKAGMRTNRQSFEESLWHRLAYHCFREYGASNGVFRPMVEEETGEILLCFDARPEIDAEPKAIVQIQVPRTQVAGVLQLLSDPERGETAFSVEILPLDVLAWVAPEDIAEPSERPVLARLQALGLDELSDSVAAERHRYGTLFWVDDLGVLVDSEETVPEDDVVSGPLDLANSRLPTTARRAQLLDKGLQEVDSPVSSLGIFTDYDFIEIEAEGGESADHLLTIRCHFGDEEVPIGDLVRAKLSGQPYLQTESGWIDMNAPVLRSLGSLLKRKGLMAEGQAPDRVRLTSAEILRLRAASAKPIHVQGAEGSQDSTDRSDFIRRLLDMRPVAPLVLPRGLTSTLRPYQQLGVEWLKFLYDNRLAGLLCDDMGLGKTHQAMALMAVLREQYGVDAPFLVVCPRTVISHWRNKLREHAPGLHGVDHHGPQRDLEQSLKEGDVILTSYGVMRNDVDQFKEVPWGLAVFDEVQQIKNRNTQGYQAAVAVPARMKLGMTGTPIENALSELRGLFDLILPGYLGSEDDFRERFGTDFEAEADSWHIAHLRRLTAPFVLRRVKTAVLDELPAKIEDVRTCSLSDEQVALYRSAIETKGVVLIQKLRDKAEPLPYIHIFALLNVLKQVCDHPALAVNDIANYEKYDSGKWDLFEELLAEGLDSGQKVVVFTQYLGMIAILERHVRSLGVEFVTLTGASRNRGQIVDRFNNDPACRVFLGSLKAGGTGIDLVGGSVVIHYDRWWNAAREDQATDRLYRIGQKRVVHVFKLITEDTLEERIAAIIDRKRRLMTSVVQEDDPKLNKIFSREELIELLKEV